VLSPKRKAEIGTLLDGADIPDAYVDTFEAYANNGLVSMSAFQELMRAAQLSDSNAERILSLVLPGDSSTAGLSRAKLNVALALIALSQQGEELSLDAVDDMRHKKLPVPKLEPKQQSVESTPAHPAVHLPSPAKSQTPSASPVKAASRSEDPTASSTADDPWSNGSSMQAHHYTENPTAAEQSTDSPSYTSPASQGTLDFDAITVTALEGKEGMPLWKHLNYT
jgi:sorting nexin-8